MSTITAPVSKYVLKPLEDEIGLFDRKLAHLLKYEIFASEADRQAAAAKLNSRRERVVRTIRDLTEPAAADAPQELAPPSKRKRATPKPAARSKTKAIAKPEPAANA